QPLGNLRMHFEHSDRATDYRRALDLTSALATVSYRVGEVTFVREIFASAVDDVLVVRLSSNTHGAISLTLQLESPHPATSTLHESNRIALSGWCPRHVDPEYRKTEQPILYAADESGKGMHFESQVQILLTGGHIQGNADNTLSIKNADEVLFLYTA